VAVPGSGENRLEQAVVVHLARRTGFSSPQAAVKRLAHEALVAAYGGLSSNLPVDLGRVSETLRVWPPNRTARIQADAVLMPQGDRFSMTLKVGTGISAARQRFSWAHELCHTFFYDSRNGNLIRAVPGGSQLEEDLCDIGARYLLLPTEPMLRLVEHLGGFRSIVESVLDGAKRAAVSPSTLLARARQFDVWEHVGFACYSGHVRNRELTLTPEWSSRSRSTRLGFSNSLVRPPSLLHQAFATGGVRRGVLSEEWISPRRRVLVEAKRYSETMLLSAVRVP